MARYTLNFFNLDRKPNQDYCLSFPVGSIYSKRVDEAFPSIKHIGWREKGKLWFTYLKDPSDDQIDALRGFMELMRQTWILTCPSHMPATHVDALTSCHAMSLNFQDDCKERTRIGDLENRAKYRDDAMAANELANLLTMFVLKHPVLRGCCYVAGIPGSPDKTNHLPSDLARSVSESTNIKHFESITKKNAPQVKNLSREQKLGAIQHAFEVNSKIDRHSSILLIDDLYQSGTTMWHVGHILKEQGADRVYGLTCVKSMRDTGNV